MVRMSKQSMGKPSITKKRARRVASQGNALQRRGWERFVLEQCLGARVDHLAAVIGQSVADVTKVLATGKARSVSNEPPGFEEMFVRWHGRAPKGSEWPAPRHHYGWQQAENNLLRKLLPLHNVTYIAKALSKRLQTVTGDPNAARTIAAVRLNASKLGLKTCTSKAQIKPPPKGFVPLVALSPVLSIKRSSLTAFAALGYLPTAVQCRPLWTWYIDAGIARAIIDDHKAGHHWRLQEAWYKWQHPENPHPGCTTCATIWGDRGPPGDSEGFYSRFPILARSAQRHLLLSITKKLTEQELAFEAGCSISDVRRAVGLGFLVADEDYCNQFTREAATRWITQGRPTQ